MAGIPVGVVVAGIGSRLAMLLLRLTSPMRCGVSRATTTSPSASFTLAGTYNLLVLGAAIGIIGAAAYQWVRPWLLGPWWFRRLTTALGSGVVVGSLLLHADGIDFTVLKPTWLAIGLFIAVPALFGLAIGPAVDRIGRPGSWTTRGWKTMGHAGRARRPVPSDALRPGGVDGVFAVWLMIRTIRPRRVAAGLDGLRPGGAGDLAHRRHIGSGRASSTTSPPSPETGPPGSRWSGRTGRAAVARCSSSVQFDDPAGDPPAGVTGSFGGGIGAGTGVLAGHVTGGDVAEVVWPGMQDHGSTGDVGRVEPAGHRSRFDPLPSRSTWMLGRSPAWLPWSFSVGFQ